MGAPMLAALRNMGARAKGFDVVEKPDQWITTDVERFTADLETLITVVRDAAQTDDVLFGAQNMVNRASKLARIVICSTLSPRYVKALRDRVPAHITLIDAPMSGAQIAAENAALSFMVGGSPTDIEDAQMLFTAMGKHVHHMGPYGAGMQAKVLNNLLAASNTAMTRLVLDWADKTELDQDKLLNLIHTSSGQNWFASNFDQIEFARDGLAEDNTIAILVKDVASALDAAPKGADTSLPEQVQKAVSRLGPRQKNRPDR